MARIYMKDIRAGDVIWSGLSHEWVTARKDAEILDEQNWRGENPYIRVLYTTSDGYNGVMDDYGTSRRPIKVVQ